MLWQCKNCKVLVEHENYACPQCGATSATGEPSPATKLLKDTFGSALFIIAAMCLTAAFILGNVLSAIGYNQYTSQDVKDAVESIEEVSDTFHVPDVVINQFVDLVEKGDPDLRTSSVEYGSILIIIGMWLLVGQSSKKTIRVQKGGLVLLEIDQIFGLVGEICGILSVIGLGVIVGWKTDWLLKLLDLPTKTPHNHIVNYLREIIQHPMFKTISLCLVGTILLSLIVALIFTIACLKGINIAKYMARSGNYCSKKISGFIVFVLILSFALTFFDSVIGLITLDVNSAVTLLISVAQLLIAICVLQYNKKIKAVFAPYLEETQPEGVYVNAETTQMEDSAWVEPIDPLDAMAENVQTENPFAEETPAPISDAEEVTSPIAEVPMEEEMPITETPTETNLEAESKKCPRCGMDVPEKSFFCLNCGQKL